MNRNRSAFTLVELLVVVAIIGILVSLTFLLAPDMIQRANMTKSLSNMRNIGAGFQGYANDNDFNLPPHSTSDKWPRLTFEYLKDTKVYADPSDPKNFQRGKDLDPLADGQNNTSYIMNGFNDQGSFDDPDHRVKLPSIEKPSQTILLGMQSGTANFYMDFVEHNQDGVLRKEAFHHGANYLFVDGSVRFMTVTEYNANDGDRQWLVDKSAEIP